MTWLVLTILLLVAGGIAGMVAIESAPGSDGRVGGGVVAGLCGLGFVILTLVSGIYIISAGHLGVVYGFGGGKIVGSLNSGTHFVAPWREVKDASVQTQAVDFDFLGDQAAVSKESQAVFATLQVNYHLDQKRVIWLYTNVGSDWFSKLMEGRAAQDFKEVTSEYSTPTITPNREEIRRRVLSKMRGELAQYSVRIDNVQIKNLHFTQAYTDAITAKQVAAQRALAAQSQAQAVINKANGDAAAILINATKQAQANLRLSKSITPNLIAYQYVQKLAAAHLIVTNGNSSVLIPGLTPVTAAAATAGKR